MSKFKEDFMHKYAYNINNSTKGKRIKIGNTKNYIQINRGFYDEIENKDISIKQKEKELRKIKYDSLREFVFTNKEIPEKWKKKLTYQNDIIRILTKDNNFLYYVGRGGHSNNQSNMNETFSTKMYTTDNFKKNENIKGLKKTYSQILFPKINNKHLSEDKTNIKKELINKNENKTLEEDLSMNENNSSNIKMSNTKYKLNKKEIMSDKDIVNLLEEFKIAYPIKIKKEEKHEESSEDKKKEKYNKKNLLFTRTYNLSSSSLLQTRKGYNPFDNIHKIKAKRQRAFRQNIFNNLIPLKNKNNTDNMTIINSNGKLRKAIVGDEKYGPFLNFDYEKFYKRIKINNPIIERQLENINFYGPYYSYCPPCLNRNLEYYNHLEANQCLQLIQFIRKMRGKKNIINIKESTTRSSEKKMEKKISSFEENINDNESIMEKRESIELSQ